jgi:hypothetical protein
MSGLPSPKWILAAAVLIAVTVFSDIVHACPDCALGREVRARVLSESFWVRLGVAALPLLLLAAIAVVLYRIGLDRRQEETS